MVYVLGTPKIYFLSKFSIYKNKYRQGCRDKGNTCALLVEIKIIQPLKKSVELPQKLATNLPYDPSILLDL
jgi:hypothetical protein